MAPFTRYRLVYQFLHICRCVITLSSTLIKSNNAIKVLHITVWLPWKPPEMERQMVAMVTNIIDPSKHIT